MGRRAALKPNKHGVGVTVCFQCGALLGHWMPLDVGEERERMTIECYECGATNVYRPMTYGEWAKAVDEYE